MPPGVPTMLDLEIIQNTGRAFFMPPDVPAERLEALRKAFDDTMVDPALVEQMKKLAFDLAPRKGVEVQAEIERVMEGQGPMLRSERRQVPP
jgi:tripartite-type tricarboxylate transporter receptor subunit TctC